MKEEDDLRKRGTLIRACFSLGGKHVQFNVVNRETLLTVRYPEEHRDPVVTCFVQLGRPK
jgi:pyruvate-formate lyase